VTEFLRVESRIEPQFMLIFPGGFVLLILMLIESYVEYFHVLHGMGFETLSFGFSFMESGFQAPDFPVWFSRSSPDAR
jgi:hypothetical protein